MNDKCNRCKGSGTVYEKVRNPPYSEYRAADICPQCNGKGYVTEEDREAWYKSVLCRESKS